MNTIVDRMIIEFEEKINDVDNLEIRDQIRDKITIKYDSHLSENEAVEFGMRTAKYLRKDQKKVIYSKEFY